MMWASGYRDGIWYAASKPVGDRCVIVIASGDGDSDRELYAAVFGTDSEDDDDDDDELVDSDAEWEQDQENIKSIRHEWQAVEGVEGLWRCFEFLDPMEQASLVKAIEGEGWFDQPSHNQAMRFGVLPNWAVTLSSLISSSISSFKGNGVLGVPLPEEILGRTSLFDQIIENSYQPGEGIGAHVDLARFEDGIVVLSLLSSCVMQFGKLCEKMDVLLSPGDLIVLSGIARYEWTHEINRDRAEEQVWTGKVLEQERRIPVTLRRLCPEENVHSVVSTIRRVEFLAGEILLMIGTGWALALLKVSQVIVFGFNAGISSYYWKSMRLGSTVPLIDNESIS